MKYVKLEKKNTYHVASMIHHAPFDETFGINKNESDLLKEGILVEMLPEKLEAKEGHVMELRATLKDKVLYYEEVAVKHYE